jgi:integrase/recombinase XerD
MQSNKSCPLLEQYLEYLVVIKGRSKNTVKEYRTDLLMFFSYVKRVRNVPIQDGNYANIDLELIKTISLNEMYAFITHCQTVLNASAGTRAVNHLHWNRGRYAINYQLHIQNIFLQGYTPHAIE